MRRTHKNFNSLHNTKRVKVAIVPNSINLELVALKPRIYDYRRLMEKVYQKIQKIKTLVNNTRLNGEDLDIDSIALAFRKTAELIIYANLDGHQEEYDAAFPPEKNDWNIKILIDRIKLINRHYYPIPVTVSNFVDGGIHKNRLSKYEGDFMTEDKLIKMFNSCGALLHAEKANAVEANASIYMPMFIEWNNRLIRMIKTHTVFLTDTKFMIFCHLSHSGIQTVLYEAPIKGIPM